MELKKPAPQGSFGIPPKMRENIHAEQERRHQPPTPPTAAPTEPSSEVDALETPPAAAEDAAAEEKADPMKMLAEIGVTFASADFDQLITSGRFSTKIDVIPGRFSVKIQTLIPSEYNEVDELMAEELARTKMTNDGYYARHQTITLAFAVSELRDKKIPPGGVVTKLVKGKKVPDLRATALERRRYLEALAPGVLMKTTRMFFALQMAINLIIDEPDVHLKNS